MALKDSHLDCLYASEASVVYLKVSRGSIRILVSIDLLYARGLKQASSCLSLLADVSQLRKQVTKHGLLQVNR